MSASESANAKRNRRIKDIVEHLNSLKFSHGQVHELHKQLGLERSDPIVHIVDSYGADQSRTFPELCDLLTRSKNNGNTAEVIARDSAAFVTIMMFYKTESLSTTLTCISDDLTDDQICQLNDIIGQAQ